MLRARFRKNREGRSLALRNRVPSQKELLGLRTDRDSIELANLKKA